MTRVEQRTVGAWVMVLGIEEEERFRQEGNGGGK